VRRADIHVPIVLKSENLNLLEPSGPVQASNGIAFTVKMKHYVVLKIRQTYTSDAMSLPSRAGTSNWGLLAVFLSDCSKCR
jgi:hypothetical protein